MIDRARRVLRDAGRIVSFSGAGLSAESGVPTFRDAKEGGLWSKFDPTRLASPEGFRDDPENVLAWYRWRRRTIGRARPNAAHEALARRAGMVHVTQNVDDLLERAGATDVLHLHGEIAVDRCHEACGFAERVELADPPSRRRCPRCGADVRPGVVWFGESLPTEVFQRAVDAVESCDALLVVGTSAVVYPAAGLIDLARAAGARVVVVNTDAGAASDAADVEVLAPAGEALPAILG